jgi:hypothetical protein
MQDTLKVLYILLSYNSLVQILIKNGINALALIPFYFFGNYRYSLRESIKPETQLFPIRINICQLRICFVINNSR